MNINNKDKLNPTFPPAHFPTRSGFTLIELLAALVIVAMMCSVAAGVYLSKLEGDKEYYATIEIMEEIKTAILGSYAPRNYGMLISGYVADIGNLPPLNKDGQPQSLWHRGHLPERNFQGDAKIPAGWNGPYLREPAGGFLTDGWGSGLCFEKAGGSLTITSYGADKKKGGLGLDEDIKIVIREEDYMAPVGGHVETRLVSEVVVHYPKDGILETEKIEPDSSGNFVSEELNIPIGLRSITCTSSVGEKPKVIVFPVLPTLTWLGTVG